MGLFSGSVGGNQGCSEMDLTSAPCTAPGCIWAQNYPNLEG